MKICSIYFTQKRIQTQTLNFQFEKTRKIIRTINLFSMEMLFTAFVDYNICNWTVIFILVVWNFEEWIYFLRKLKTYIVHYEQGMAEQTLHIN